MQEKKALKKETRTKTESMAARVALHPFLAGMHSAHLASLTDCAMASHFTPGQILLREGEMADRFYLIETGKIVLESGENVRKPVVIETIGAGDSLGWSWMFPPYVWHFTARAVESTDAIFFYGSKLREHCERDFSLGYALFKRMTPIIIRRLQAARDKLLAVYRGRISLEPLELDVLFMDPGTDTR